MAEPKKRRALGRGLEALLPSKPAHDKHYGARAVFECAIERISPRRDQPRRHFDDDALNELAATIAEFGIIQPLVVRRLGQPGPQERFELIAGERRWRASQRAGLKQVPVVVKDVTPDKAFELALIENLQREDLNPIEVAISYQRLLRDHDSTQESLATRVGKSRVAISNVLRLLKLPDAVRSLLANGSLSEGHGRALLGAPNEGFMIKLARTAVQKQLSVRKVEQLIKQTRKPPASPEDTSNADKSAGVRDLERRLSHKLGAKSAVEHRGKGGQLVIRYTDLDELDRILGVIGV